MSVAVTRPSGPTTTGADPSRVPFDPFDCAAPTSSNVTVPPVSCLVPNGLTVASVAVSVTGCPGWAGLDDDVTVVVVAHRANAMTSFGVQPSPTL